MTHPVLHEKKEKESELEPVPTKIFLNKGFFSGIPCCILICSNVRNAHGISNNEHVGQQFRRSKAALGVDLSVTPAIPA